MRLEPLSSHPRMRRLRSTPLRKAERSTEAPGLGLLVAEPIRAVLHMAGAHVARPEKAYAGTPLGKGQPVLVLPGLGTSDSATAVLRRHLNLRGYAAHEWGLGWHTGPKDVELMDWLGPIMERVRALYEVTRQPVALVGWSLGGIAAREVARRMPGQVSVVITLGSPFANTHATHASKAFALLSGRNPEDFKDVVAQFLPEPPVPTVSVYSRTDGLVHWSACIQPNARNTKHVEVNHVSHGGMVFSTDVIRVVLKELHAGLRKSLGR